MSLFERLEFKESFFLTKMLDSPNQFCQLSSYKFRKTTLSKNKNYFYLEAAFIYKSNSIQISKEPVLG